MLDDLRLNNSEHLEQTKSFNLRRIPSMKNQKIQLQEQSMVVIRDVPDHKDYFVFPPINHENLHISPQCHQHERISSLSTSSSSSVASFSPSDADTWSVSSSITSDFQILKNSDFSGWMRIGLEILRSKLFAMVTSFRNYAAKRGAIWSIGSAAAAAVMSWWICMRFWRWLSLRRRGSQRQGQNHLIAIIKEKDERIARLLHQIAQMNEILIARHKALAAKLGE